VQKVAAEHSRDELNASEVWSDRIVTEIIPTSIFYPAEEYHQKYFMKKGGGKC